MNKLSQFVKKRRKSLGRLAIDETLFRQGFGELLLVDALKRTYEVSINVLGSIALIVDPIDENALAFYERYGFISLPDSGKMFLPMSVIAQLELE
jgi:ribosomal protein S18 acetylase RimI-like enzyme